ncbi:hypothetical protein F4604DRAFT_1929658 [Suillus subluteus]|nr:hypothetical protein F4604DRAFT_1929658 [Suillus subluteus]
MHEVCDKSSSSTSNVPTHSQSELAFDAVHFSLSSLRFTPVKHFCSPLTLHSSSYITAKTHRVVTPTFGLLAAVEARLEDEYRASDGRIGRESEVFYDGGDRERDILTRVYLRLIKHANSVYKFCSHQTLLHLISSPIVLSSSQSPYPYIRTHPAFQNLNQHPSQICVAYKWIEDSVITLRSAAGYGLIAIPLLIMRKRSRGAGVVDEEGKEKRLMYAYKDLQEVAGLTGRSTKRLYTLLSTLHNLPPLSSAPPRDGDTSVLKNADICIPRDPFTSSDSPSPTPHSPAITSKLKAHTSTQNH